MQPATVWLRISPTSQRMTSAAQYSRLSALSICNDLSEVWVKAACLMTVPWVMVQTDRVDGGCSNTHQTDTVLTQMTSVLNSFSDPFRSETLCCPL
jgi:hypothetical protein